MSEYQFYDFRAIDQSLTREEKEIVSSWSSRAHVSSGGATFTYHYSDFGQDPLDVVGKYFDMMFYIANWGSRRLIIKIPEAFFDERIRQYEIEGLEIFDYKKSAIIDIDVSDEDYHEGWLEGEGMLNPFVSLRDDIIAGDYRCLYLIWLKLAVLEGLEEKQEPEVPNGLQELDGRILEFAEIFMIDNDLISVASQVSKPLQPHTTIDYSSTLQQLSETDKNDWLLRLTQNEPRLSQKFIQHLSQSEVFPSTPGRRTVAEIVAAAGTFKKDGEAKEKQKEDAEKLEKLKILEKRAPDLWVEVFNLIDQKKVKSYDEAVTLLKSLRILAVHKQKETDFVDKVQHIKEKYKRLSGLITRIQNARL